MFATEPFKFRVFPHLHDFKFAATLSFDMAETILESITQPSPAQHEISLTVLGSFSLRGSDGRPIALNARKCRQLLAYLAVPSGQKRPRDQLASLLWSDRQEEQARASLRTALSGIRRAIGEDALVVESDMVSLRAGYIDTDFDALKRLSASKGSVSKLEDFYAGELLASLEHDSELFMAWLRGLRAECADRAVGILEQNADRLAALGDHKPAIALMRESLLLEPLKEQTHRKIMALYTASGERGMALAQFRTCKEVLFHELNVEPDPETQDLADSIAMRDKGALLALKQEAAQVALTALPLTPDPDKNMASIAVLPFVNMSGDAEQSYFADGITEDIIVDLSGISALSVAANTSSGLYRGVALSAAEISKTLGVKYLLQGSVRTAGKSVRISASLIDAHAERQIWAARYDRTLDNIFELQSEISAAIVDALKINLKLANDQAPNPQATHSGEAYQIYLHAKSIRQSRVHGYEELSSQLFARAVSLDPDFALAHAALAELEVSMSVRNKLSGAVLKAALARAMIQCEKALQIDPSLAEAHLALGQLYSARNQHNKAKEYYLKAVALKPDFAAGHSALGFHYLEIEGNHEGAFLGYQQAYLLNPINCHCINIMAAAESFGRQKELQLYASQILILAKHRVSLNPHDYDAVGLISYAYRNLGELEHARYWLRIVSAFEIDDAYFIYNLACLYASLGSADEALELLERSLSHPQASPGLTWIKEVDADMEPLRNDPRFFELLNRYFD